MPSCRTDSDLAHPDEKTIQSLFNQIAGPYDFLNSLLSFGLDHCWRLELVRRSLQGNEKSILDLGVGTGKSLAAFCDRKRFSSAVGIDFSEAMLALARKRLGKGAFLSAGDFHCLPFGPETFDLISGSFMLRSVQDLRAFFVEVKRVLKPSGRIAFLELTRPRDPLLRELHRFYLNLGVPILGRLFSRHPNAYRFLSRSVQSFLEPSDLKKELEALGFSRILIQPLNFGIVTLIQGEKESHE